MLDIFLMISILILKFLSFQSVYLLGPEIICTTVVYILMYVYSTYTFISLLTIQL